MIEILKGKVVPEKVGEADIFSQVYNPDVLLCLANLSNDEVFTPPEVANQMLDMLPQELFEDPNTKFLDPACKSGVFLREIAKRLIKGLEDKIPDLQERIDHICKEQLYGIAITELTSLLSRRSVYCSKYPNGPFSIAHFDNVEGNIRFKNCKHEWVGEKNLWTFEHGKKVRTWRKCRLCGATEELFGEETRNGLEYHAYEFIHSLKPEEIFNMKFDVICSNPPYQISDGGGLGGSSAIPIYDKFVTTAKKLSPRYITMIIPSRWFAGGKGLDSFRDSMINDGKIRVLHDFMDAADCFPGVEIKGGVCYFLWDRDNPGLCEINTHKKGNVISSDTRSFKEEGSDVFIRYNEAVSIYRKIKSFKEKSFMDIVSTRQPFGITVLPDKNKTQENNILLYRRGGTTYCSRKDIKRNINLLSANKVLISKAYNGGDSYPHQVIGKPFIAKENSACTETYLVIGPFANAVESENAISYIRTKFFRFLVLLHKSSQNAAQGVYQFVPMQDFSKPWTDSELYKKYGISDEEIAFIDSMIRPMDLGGDDNG